MDYTKGKLFVAFRHKNKDTYWINGGYEYETDSPMTFSYTTKEDKEIVAEVYKSMVENWDLKDVEAVILKVDGVVNFDIISKKKRKKNEDNS